jgi:hypothetical protein
MSFFDGSYLFGEGANYYSEETVNYNYGGDNVGPSHHTYDEGDGRLITQPPKQHKAQ